MRMEKRKFRIGELAQHLNVERFVIRFWEKEFNFKAHRSIGGQRFYDENDLRRFQTIKELLYDKKFTIAGAKKQILKKSDPEAKPSSSIVASHVTSIGPQSKRSQSDREYLPQELVQQLRTLRTMLTELRNML